VVLQVFQKHVSNVSFVFRHMLQLLHLDVSKLDQVLHLPPRLLLSRPSVKREKRAQAEAVPTGVGSPHVLAGERSRRDMGGQARDKGSGVGVQMEG
jgi:hypothetical protein